MRKVTFVLLQLAYLSRSGGWTRAELLELLRASREANVEHGVTGVLLHRNSGFLQLLEGEPAEVRRLFANIVADDRHTDVTQIWECADGPRWFSGWSMAFRDLEDDPVTEPGLADVLRGPADASHFGHEVVLQLWRLLRPADEPFVDQAV